MGCTLAPPETSSSTQLGSWFATVLFWRPWVALFVNEKTLVPLLIPFAPAASMFNRFVPALAALLEAHGVERDFISEELAASSQIQVARTSNRSVVGSMNEFAYLADVFRGSLEPLDLMALSLRLAETPCSPLYKSHVTPHDELLGRTQGDQVDGKRQTS